MQITVLEKQFFQWKNEMGKKKFKWNQIETHSSELIANIMSKQMVMKYKFGLHPV